MPFEPIGQQTFVPVEDEEPIQQSESASSGGLGTAVNFGVRTFLNNLMATPSATGELLAGGAAGVQTLAETPFQQGEQGFGQRFSENLEQQQGQFPASALRAVPRPTVQDVGAGMAAAPALMPGGQSPGEAFQEQRQRIARQEQQTREDHPIATMTGEIAGDIATLAAGRSPFASGLVRRSANRPVLQNKQAREALETLAREDPELVPQVAQLIGSGRLARPGATRLWRRIKESDPVKSVARGSGKTLEAGLEGAVLSAIKDNDPFVNAGLASGSQAAASMFGATLGVPSSLKGLAWRAVGYTALFRTLQEFGPGENDTWDATDTAFDKMALGLTLGTASQALGGRFRGARPGQRFAEDLPKISDAINTIPRGGLLSVANRIQQEREQGENTTLATLEALQTNPDAFSEATANRLDRALKNGNFAEEIEKLSQKSEFMRQLEEAMP